MVTLTIRYRDGSQTQILTDALWAGAAAERFRGRDEVAWVTVSGPTTPPTPAPAAPSIGTPPRAVPTSSA